VQYETAVFSSEEDALIAEAALIGTIRRMKTVKALNRQSESGRRFGPRYPFPSLTKRVGWRDLPQAIVVTIAPDTLEDDKRVAPNSQWRAAEIAERVRMYWTFSRSRVERWKAGAASPDVLVAVLKTSGRIAAVFAIDNERWFRDPANKNAIRAVPLKRKSDANANGMQGMLFTGRRQGGAVQYGPAIRARK
jgi:hypothetical protein